MTPERPKPEYFTHFESQNLPDCNWREMLARKEVLSPLVITKVLLEAREFLTTEPGPNLEKRRRIVPPWISYWTTRLVGLTAYSLIETRPGFVRSEKLMTYDRVGGWLEERGCQNYAGVLFVAGAEGHAGHVYAANYMASQRVRGRPLFSVWSFEQDSYLMCKERKAPFLPLELRLSMWNFHRPEIITVSPEKRTDVSDKDHYDKLFKLLGVKYCFADEKDPYRDQKIQRGRTDINVIIPHIDIEGTTERVEKLMPDTEFWEEEEISGEDLLLEWTINAIKLQQLNPSFILLHYPDLLVDGAVFVK